jgi:phosphatidylglycerophosphate synthase
MNENKIFNASNSLSFIRLLLVIPAWFAFNNFDNNLARYSVAAIGVIATITDILDGYLARKLNQITEFGKVIDPLADKVLIVFVVFKSVSSRRNSRLLFLYHNCTGCFDPNRWINHCKENWQSPPIRLHW